MAQLKDTAIDGTLEVTSNATFGRNLYGIHPTTGENHQILSLSSAGNTVVGYDGHANKNGSTNVYGNDINLFVANAETNFQPYRRAGHSLNFEYRGAGYVTSSGTQVIFLVPFSMPIIGSPTVTISSNNGFILRQNEKYTHGSTYNTYVKPDTYHNSLI